MASPFTSNNKRVLSRSNTHGSKSVAFQLNPSEALSRAFEKPKKDSSPTALQRNATNIFKRAPFRLKLGFPDTRKRSKTRRAKSKDDTDSLEEQEEDENPLQVTDTFQYRAEPILEGDDFVIDITHLKRNKGEPGQLIEPESPPAQKKFNIVTVKSKPIMRRKSDASTWSGGVSELERKTAFMTFEYVTKQIELDEEYLNAKRPQIDTITYRGTPSTRSGKSSTKFDGSPRVMGKGLIQSVSRKQDHVLFDFNIEKKRQKSIGIYSTPKSCKMKPNQREDTKERGGTKGLRGTKFWGEMRMNDISPDEISRDYPTSRTTKKGVVMNNLMQEYYPDTVNNRKILPKSSSVSKSTIKLQEYYKPLKLTSRTKLLIATNSTAREQKVDRISISTLVKCHKRDLSSGTLASKTAQMESDNSIGNNSNSPTGGETIELNDDDANQKKPKKLIKIHQTLVAKMYDYKERSTSRTIRLGENKAFLANFPRKENQSLSREREKKGQLSQLPMINTDYGSFFNMKQSSIDRGNKKSPYEIPMKLKKSELTIFNTSTESEVSKLLKTERLATSEERVFKFKPKPPKLRKLDGEYNKKRMKGSQLRD